MKRVLALLLLLLLPVSALADGKVFPPTALPVNVTIPDQRALIHFTNGTERLVIETRFTGAGTNFAWVVPLPSQPVIEEATTGLFPTLQYLFRPRIVHDVPRYYLRIFALIWLGYLLAFVRPTGRIKWLDVAASLLVVAGINTSWLISHDWNGPERWALVVETLIVFADLMCVVCLVRFWGQLSAFTELVIFSFLGAQVILIALATSTLRTAGMASTSSPATVSILDRKLVGIFETTTIASRDPKALQTWLRDNGFTVPTNSEPVIESYVHDGWVFVTAKVRRDDAKLDTSTPHPLSFTFQTDRPVYPMRLTGVDNGPLSVELYVFGPARAKAPHFKVVRCTRPDYPKPPEGWSRWSPETPNIVHPLLRKWVDGSPVATKLTATLSPADMRNDVWFDWTPFSEKKNHLFSQQGALTTALNWGAGLFAAGLLVVCLLAFASETHKTKLPRLIGIVTVISIAFIGLFYLSLPKIEVKLVKGRFYSYWREEQLTLRIALRDLDWHTTAEARAGLHETISNPTNAAVYGLKNWDNYFVGGQVHEEDSPGNYVLRETNNQLQLITFNPNGGEEICETWDLHMQH